LRFFPKDEQEFFKYHDTSALELDGDLDGNSYKSNYIFSDKDVAMVFYFEGLPTTTVENNVIKCNFIRGIEGLPIHNKQDIFAPTKSRRSTIY